MDKESHLIYESWSLEEAFRRAKGLRDAPIVTRQAGKDQHRHFYWYSILDAAKILSRGDDSLMDESIQKINVTILKLIDEVLDAVETWEDTTGELSSTDQLILQWNKIDKASDLDLFLAKIIRAGIQQVSPEIKPLTGKGALKGFAARDLFTARMYRTFLIPDWITVDGTGNVVPAEDRKSKRGKVKQETEQDMTGVKKFHTQAEYEVVEIAIAGLSEEAKLMYDRLPSPGDPHRGSQLLDTLDKFTGYSRGKIIQGLNEIMEAGGLQIYHPEPEETPVTGPSDSDLDRIDRHSGDDYGEVPDDAPGYWDKIMGGPGLGGGSMDD